MDHELIFGEQHQQALKEWAELKELARWIEGEIVKKLAPIDAYGHQRAQALAKLMINPALWDSAAN